VNEIQLIRDQLALECRHAREIAAACAEALGRRESGPPPPDERDPYRQACVDYLACVLAWFEERNQRLAELALAGAAREHGALTDALARPGKSREALERLAGACTRTAGWGEFAQFFRSAWCTRREALDAWLTRHGRIAEWRAVGALDADSILRERELYARCAAAQPPGLHGAAAGEARAR
jgi:hypothetical protein